MKTLILYTSKYGTTKECAEYLNKNIENSQLTRFDDFQGNIESYDRIIVGTPIYMGKFPKVVSQFLTKNQDELLEKKYTIFYCGMTEELFEDAVLKSVPYLLVDDTSVIPVGGAFKLESMGFINRLLLRMTGVKESISKVDFNTLDKISQM